jgi:hypothetical protein
MKRAFKDQIFTRQLQKIENFNDLQKTFKETFRTNEIKSSTKYEIHIPAHNYSEWQKISIDKYIERQNTELCRLFKIAENNHLNDLRIIYVSPVQISKEIVKYYKKLLELASERQL